MKRKNIIAILLCFVLLLSVMAGCKGQDVDKKPDDNGETSKTDDEDKAKDKEDGKKEDEKGETGLVNKEGFPIVNEPVTLKVMVRRTPVQPPHEDIYVWQEYEKETGVKIDWVNVPDSDLAEKRNLAVTSGDLPDVFLRCGFPNLDVLRYGEQGVFIELNDLIDEYGPNLKKIMEEYEEVGKGLPEYNGKIYAYPVIFDSEPIQIGTKLFINKAWVDKVGKEMPTTTDELYDLLKAFREQDPNGNGEKDEIPWSTTGIAGIINALKGAWGLQNRGSRHGNVDFNEETQELRFIPTSPEYKELLQYVNKLYTEELIDQEIFTMDHPQLIAKGEQNLVGAFCFVNSQAIGATHEEEYEGIPEALEGPHGDKLWVQRGSHLAAKGPFLITNECEHPEVAVRWIDYFYSEEGATFFYLGKEGETYEKTADGELEYKIDELEDMGEGTSFDQVVGKYTPYMGGGNPVFTKTAYFKGGETHPIPAKAADNVAPYIPEEIWSVFNYTIEEAEQLTELENDIFTYVNQMQAEFITGKKPFDQWDDYVQQIEKMGLEDYLKIYTAGYERYAAN